MEPALHYSLAHYTANFLLQGSAVVYILSLRNKPDYLWFFAAYLAAWSLNSITWIGFGAFLSPWTHIFYVTGMASLTSTYFIVLFAYSFLPLPSQKREAQVVTFVGALWTGAPVFFHVWTTWGLTPTMIPSREAFGFPFVPSLRAVGITTVPMTLLCLSIFLRKWAVFRREGRASDARVMLRMAAAGSILLLDFSYFLAISYRFGDYELYQIFHAFGLNLALFLETVILLNAMPQHTSFLAKLVGATLVLTLTIVSALGMVVFRDHERMLADRMRTEVLRAAENGGAPGMRELAYVRWTDAAGRTKVLAAQVPPDLLPGSAAKQSGLHTAVAGDGTRIEQCYKSVRFAEAGTIFEGGRLLSDHLRNDVQPIVLRFLIAVFSAYLMVLLLLPAFFRGSLIRPLNELLAAVRRVDRGDYSAVVPVRHADEIGRLARSFNEMVGALREYRDDRERTLRLIHENQLQVERSRLDARLAWLKRAIQPHFVMNSLNTIVGLMREDPARAEELVRSLGRELRAMLDVVSERTIPASVELGLCRSHVQIMSYRQEQPHQLEVAGFSGEERVPPFVFHTLVENAFTHGGAESALSLRIERQREADRTVYVFEAPQVTGRISTERTGTQYVKSRLEEAYPGRWELEQGSADGLWCVRIVVPSL